MLALRLPVFATATLLFFTALIPSARAEPETSPPEASAVPAAPAPSSAEEWERSYGKARTAMRDGFFTAAAAAMTKLAEQAPDATRKRVALEASGLAIYWSRRAYVLRTEPFFVIELKTRIVHMAGIRVDPNEAWMVQVLRNLCDPADGFLRRARFLVHDRDPLFTKQWKLLLSSSGVTSVAIPAQSPNCNPHAERFIKSIRDECLDHFIVFGEAQLRHLVREYVARYNAERYHQGVGGKLLTEKVVAFDDNSSTAIVKTRSRLNGTLNFYHREAA